jgi:hypothetical protein
MSGGPLLPKYVSVKGFANDIEWENYPVNILRISDDVFIIRDTSNQKEYIFYSDPRREDSIRFQSPVTLEDVEYKGIFLSKEEARKDIPFFDTIMGAYERAAKDGASVGKEIMQEKLTKLHKRVKAFAKPKNGSIDTYQLKLILDDAFGYFISNTDTKEKEQLAYIFVKNGIFSSTNDFHFFMKGYGASTPTPRKIPISVAKGKPGTVPVKVKKLPNGFVEINDGSFLTTISEKMARQMHPELFPKASVGPPNNSVTNGDLEAMAARLAAAAGPAAAGAGTAGPLPTYGAAPPMYGGPAYGAAPSMYGTAPSMYGGPAYGTAPPMYGTAPPMYGGPVYGAAPPMYGTAPSMYGGPVYGAAPAFNFSRQSKRKVRGKPWYHADDICAYDFATLAGYLTNDIKMNRNPIERVQRCIAAREQDLHERATTKANYDSHMATIGKLRALLDLLTGGYVGKTVLFLTEDMSGVQGGQFFLADHTGRRGGKRKTHKSSKKAKKQTRRR